MVNAGGRTIGRIWTWRQEISRRQAIDGEGVEIATVAGLTVKDSGIDYLNAQSRQPLRVSGADLKTRKLRPGEPWMFR